MMKTVTTILVVCLLQCTYLRAAPNPWIWDSINSCLSGVKSMSVMLYNSQFPKGQKIGVEESCGNIDLKQTINFITHGFMSSANATNFQNLASTLVEKGETALVIDWSQGACTDDIPGVNTAEYLKAAHNTRQIGQLVAKYIITLINECKMSLNNIRLFGHSLGAHVCGFAAKAVKNVTNEKVPIIIGFDPAAPDFDMITKNKCEDRLCKDDAKRVVTFHTSILGIAEQIGHLLLEFGKMQPGCNPVNVACSHSKSIVYGTDILKNEPYFGVPMEKEGFWKGMWNSLTSSNKSKDPTSNIMDCTVMNDSILKSDSSLEGQYRMLSTEEASNCKQ